MLIQVVIGFFFKFRQKCLIATLRLCDHFGIWSGYLRSIINVTLIRAMITNICQGTAKVY
jgi:hypothetical protein